MITMKQLNKWMFLKLISFLVLFIFIITSCNKDQVQLQHNVQISDSTLAKQLSSSIEFKSILLNLNDIKIEIKNSSNLYQENIINIDLYKEATSIENEYDLNLFLLKLGYNNADTIVKYTVINNALVLKAFTTFPELYKLDKERILAIFKLAYKHTKSDNSNLVKFLMVADECATNYGYGMEDCSENLGYDLLNAQADGLFVAYYNPALGMGIALTLSGLAYLKEYNCKITVV